MARKKKQPEHPVDEELDDTTDTVEGLGHNSGDSDLSDEDLQALFFHHKRAYETALAAKKKADADLKNACKLAKAELGTEAVASIKDAILLETEEGEAKLKATIDRQLRVARWMAVPLDAQAAMFAEGMEDRTPLVDRARAEGKRYGMEGKPKQPPHAPHTKAFDAWMTGYDEGQSAIFNIQKSRDAKDFDETPIAEGTIGEEAPSYEVTH